MTLPHKALAAGAIVALLATAALVARPEEPPAKGKAKNPLDASRFVAFDGFDGKLSLNWQPVRPDESHVSLKKHPGQLTIVTQKGTIHGDAEKGNPALPAKNIYLIDNPLAKDADFVVTTCIVDFKPAANYHQAGLILYDDDDNYLKFTFEFNSPKQAGVYAVVVNEQDAKPKHTAVDLDAEVTKLWLRFTRKDGGYEFSTSIDGERFVAHGTTQWKDKDGPKRLGLIAKNGGQQEVEELDARFEFFELKSP